MAAKDISLVGATFYGVPQVDLPISGGGTASFVEISDTTATAADVASGKYFYTSAGVKTEGTASGGSANIEELNVTQNGTYTASGGVDGYSPVIVNVSGGGGDSWSWMGKNPTKVKDYGTTKVWLKDSGYNTWTPTTTSTQIAAASALTGYSWSRSDYDYIVYYRFHSRLEYGSGATGTAQLSDNYTTAASIIYGYPNSYTNMVNDTASGQSASALVAPQTGIFYLNTSGAQAYSTSSVGVKIQAITNPTVNATTITPSKPRIDAQCNASTFSTTNAAAVNKNTSYYEINISIWRIDKGTSPHGYARADIRDMWLNGIS